MNCRFQLEAYTLRGAWQGLYQPVERCRGADLVRVDLPDQRAALLNVTKITSIPKWIRSYVLALMHVIFFTCVGFSVHEKSRCLTHRAVVEIPRSVRGVPRNRHLRRRYIRKD
jgi:hypothetical protein